MHDLSCAALSAYLYASLADTTLESTSTHVTLGTLTAKKDLAQEATQDSST